ncbi:peptide-methionine (R)-S-oxide reductase [Rhodobacteraceae bacterium]|nr:peptide-methionine (R)-S-oxide reductase [Paracoccaceae bacterium]
MTQTNISRRTLLTSTTFVAASLELSTRPLHANASTDTAPVGPNDENFSVYIPEESSFPYEVQRSKEEWKAHFDDDEEAYNVMRLARTEKRKTTDLWKEAHDGDYNCRGCDLPLYEGRWFQPLDKGWVFFHQAKPHSVMLALDGPVPQYGQKDAQLDEDNALTEIHCRRCGSHVGHQLEVSGMFLHCINGTALTLA